MMMLVRKWQSQLPRYTLLPVEKGIRARALRMIDYADYVSDEEMDEEASEDKGDEGHNEVDEENDGAIIGLQAEDADYIGNDENDENSTGNTEEQ